MDNRSDYLQKLYDDLLEQFKGKPNITVFQKAMARQLDDVYAFFYQLRVMRWLKNAEGAQLDGIGNIVDLSRTDALVWSNVAGLVVPMEDDLYRLYLMFKIFLNTSEATYADVVRTLRMFWPYAPIYYSEQIEHPATMFFTTSAFSLDDTAHIYFSILLLAKKVKSAGVALHFGIPFDTIPIQNRARFLLRDLGIHITLRTKGAPILLDGTRVLDGTWALSGWSAGARMTDFAMHMKNENKTALSGTVEMTGAWYLDGNIPLDGSRNLGPNHGTEVL